ncbi:MAG: Succinate dehydrogenase (ubiquinone) [Dehalococcoidia bacterium]|nr:Succinate dehydrogenase (ubiquinone) [Dehalococcoidia bacterium]
MEELQSYTYDVLVIGAGGAGLRAAIEAASQGARVGLVSKSLLGKAHTVMAEGGIAAALGNVHSEDSWQAHFRDTMRGGKLLNNWRMAHVYAQEAPERVMELERWGAVFDRTPDGKISQRAFGGHSYNRLAHVGDRTGLEMLRTLQDQAVYRGIEVHMECIIHTLLRDGARVSGAIGRLRATGGFVLFKARAVVLATGGLGRLYKITSNSWECTGDGFALASLAGADLIDMEFIQFHPTGMVWPPGVIGLLVTEGVRGDGGVLKNSRGERFMFRYVPEMFKGEYADTEEEAQRWLKGDGAARRPPDLLTRDVVAKAIMQEGREGRATPHGGAYLDIASQRSSDFIKSRLPSMYRQFKELANVDITRESMEVGPTCHYMMGGIRVDPETQATTVDGLYAAGEVAAGLHGSNRLGGNSLSDLLVFGKRAGLYATEHANKQRGEPVADEAQISQAMQEMLAPFQSSGEEGPFDVLRDLRETMQQYVGIIRNEGDVKKGLEAISRLKDRAGRVRVTGTREYNPGWDTALQLPLMLTTAEAVALAALERRESRGAHTREEYPGSDDAFSKVNFVVRRSGEGFLVVKEPLPEMPQDIKKLVE